MNITPVQGGPTPDQKEMAAGNPSRGWKYGFWDCFSDPATCLLSILPSRAQPPPQPSFPWTILTSSLLLPLRRLRYGSLNFYWQARRLCQRCCYFLSVRNVLSRSCPRSHQPL